MDDITKARFKGIVIMILGAFAVAAYLASADDTLFGLVAASAAVLVFVSMPIVWPRLEASPKK